MTQSEIPSISTAMPTRQQIPRSEVVVLVSLALLAGLRVFLASAAMPLFNNVDEGHHYDLVYRYAHSGLPLTFDGLHPEVLQDFQQYFSPEYLRTREEYPEGMPLPLWELPEDQREDNYRQLLSQLRHKKNHETYSPPVYYSLAAAWYHLGRQGGLSGGELIYWIRFLNIPILCSLVVVSYLAARTLYPDDRWLRIGVAALIACANQDIFYAINSDALSALLVPLAMLLLWNWKGQGESSAIWGVAAGLCTAAAFLVKYSNVPLVVLLAFRCMQNTLIQRKGVRPGSFIPCFAAAIPISAWLIRNRIWLGDWAGTHHKTELLGWTTKPVWSWVFHPVFTPEGFWFFWSETICRIWRGEVVWHLVPLTPPIADHIFVIITTLTVIAAAVCWLRDRKAGIPNCDGDLLWMFGASMLFLLVCSIAFDFGECLYPSRESPYMVSGRLILGVLAPLCILTLRGAKELFVRTGSRYGPTGLLSVLLLTNLLCWITTLWTTLPSRYNWFHLP